MENKSNIEGLVFDIQRWSIHDGPGVRTVVFLKGCPLHCIWCCNPESQSVRNELVFFKDKCIGCHRCKKNCPFEAVTIENGKQVYNREICKVNCFDKGLNLFPCTKECYAKAIRPVAEVKTVDDVMKEVEKDSGIYKESNVGGLTIGGGEMSMQPQFSLSLLKRAKESGITTAIETCGFANWVTFEAFLTFVDYIYCDIKFFDSKRHEELTGQKNNLILKNAVRMSRFAKDNGKYFTIRIPLIPGISEFDDFKKILDFVKKECADITAVEIMPYHRLGRGKYLDLGRDYSLMDLMPFTEEELKPFRELLISYNFIKTL